MDETKLSTIFGLRGKTALVTGGGSGLGKAIAACLAQSGARVIIAGRREDVLLEAAAEIGHGCATMTVDLTDIPQISAFEDALHAKFGPIDILIDNAGNTLRKPFEDSTMAEFDSIFDVHVRGVLELNRACIKRLIVIERAGSITFTSSMTAYIGQSFVSGYTISKTAINGVVRGFSAEFANRNIRVNGVALGWIDTDLYRKAIAGDLPRQQKILGRIPMNKLGRPEDIGCAWAFLASPAAAYVTGQVLLVDGGGATGF